jgi:hypothetical protein
MTLATQPWDDNRQDATILRGVHKLALDHLEFLPEELLDFVQKGFWMILPVTLLKKYPQIYKNLQVSPMGVVPQRARRPCIIVDYTFFGLNNETVKMAPRDAMKFGKALQRIIQSLVDANPKYGPVYLIKVDIADGFYRIWLNTQDILKLACTLPVQLREEPLLALPLVLLMGWTESPPCFCPTTETIADITNKCLVNHWPAPPHRLEDLASIDPVPDEDSQPALTLSGTSICQPLNLWPDNSKTQKLPLKKVDLFVDDFIGMGQGSPKELSKIRQTLLNSLDKVLRPLDDLDSAYRKEPASTKKLKQGDAAWGTRKMILGWVIDTVLMTLELPHHRKIWLLEILDKI